MNKVCDKGIKELGYAVLTKLQILQIENSEHQQSFKIIVCHVVVVVRYSNKA